MTCIELVAGLVGLWLLIQFRRHVLVTDDPEGRYWPTSCTLRARTHDFEWHGCFEKHCTRCGATRYSPPAL